MPNALDLATFMPRSPADLYEGILTQIAGVLKDIYEKIKNEIAIHVQSIANKAWIVQKGLASGEITRAHADLAIHTQEISLSSLLLYSEYVVYEIAQVVLDAVFSVISAAIRNITGISLNFGS